MKIFEYLVVGSGCSGAMVAQTLVEAGVNVTMIDTGISKDSDIKVPDGDFLDLRSSDPDQYKYFLGDKASGVSWGDVGKGEQITPPRQHIVKDVEEYIPLVSSTFSSFESLSYGGLGTGWGLQCWQYSQADLKAAGLNEAKMRKAYQVVGNRIGISATDDDAGQYTIRTLKDYQPSPSMDKNHRYISDLYESKKQALNKQGFYLGRTPLALITEDKDDRRGYGYHDMDFYSDNDKSAWRPWIAIDSLRKQRNFEYIGGVLMLSFKEQGDKTIVTCMRTADQQLVTFSCRKLILATSALGSARIVLRSLGDSGTKLPLLCNPYSYIPCIQPHFFGSGAEREKLGFTQLSLFYDKDHSNIGASVASLYSYQSLMLFRIVRHVPLNFVDARILMRYLIPTIVIMGIHHPDHASDDKYLKLVDAPESPAGSQLEAEYVLSDEEKREINSREKAFMRTMRGLGTYSLKKLDPGAGASIHYAGTLPFSQKREPFTLSSSGLLHGTRSVYVADSSGFNYLPAPGLTYSLMANAHNVAEGLLHNG